MTQTHSKMLTTRRRKKKALKESARTGKQAKKLRNQEAGGAKASGDSGASSQGA